MVAQFVENQEIEAYLEAIQQLLLDTDPDDRLSCDRLEPLVEQYLEGVADEAPFRTFLEGERAFYRGEFQEAIEYYSAVRELPQSTLSFYRALGHLYAEQGRIEEAIAALHKALSADSDDLLANRLLDQIRVKEETPPMDEEDLFNLFPHEEDLSTPSDWSPLHERRPLSSSSLIEKVRLCQEQRDEMLHRYVQESRLNAEERAASLLVLDGWEGGSLPSSTSLPEHHYRGSSGLFIRWQGKGIAINPGPHFLHRFHQLGGSIGEIDLVIVTRCEGLRAADIEELHHLNDQYNRISGECHVIHYYLEEEAHRQFSHRLKPRYRQERFSVHPLGRYLDSAEIERVTLAEGIDLSYLFPQNSRGDGVLIRLDLTESGEFLDSRMRSRSIGYLSGCGWCSEIELLYHQCDLLFAGFGRTDVEDCEKERYLPCCLGYFGTSTLAQQAQPGLMLLGEFDGRDGDLRLDIVSQLREEVASSACGVAILPAELGMRIELRELQVHCSLGGGWIDSSEVRVVRPDRAFAPLRFLSPSSLL